MRKLPITKPQRRKLRRKRGSLTGLSAGIGDYFDLDARWVRIGFAGLSTLFFLGSGGLFSFFGPALYAALVAFTPMEEEIPYQRRIAGQGPRPTVQEEEIESLILCKECNTVSKQLASFCHQCGAAL